MTQPESDRERIDAIRHLMNDLEKDWSPDFARLLLHHDVPWLLDRLAVVERERDRETELRRKAEDHVRSMQEHLDSVPYPDEYDDVERRAEHAESALLSLQNAARELVTKLQEMEKPLNAVCVIAQIHGVPYRGPSWDPQLERVSVLLPKGSA